MCFYPWCCALSCSVLSDSVILGTAADQAPLPMGILQARILGWISSNILLRREYSLSSLSEDPPEDLPKSWIKPRSPALQVDSLPSEPPGNPWCKYRCNRKPPKNFQNGGMPRYSNSLWEPDFRRQESKQGYLCNGQNCILPKFTSWNPNPQYLYLKVGSIQR